ncbi:hypothetical protein QQG55_0935 [Brugia pahangi]
MTNAQILFFTSPLLLCVLSTLILNSLKIFYAFDDELGENDEIPSQENVGGFDENNEFMQQDQDIISIESLSWNTATDDERVVLDGLLEEGYINETMLPWNSGRPLLIKVYWGASVDEIFALEVL